MKHTLFLLIVLCAFGAACSDGQTRRPVAKENLANVDELLKKQVLLTNSAKFTGNRTLEGASGFLIKHNNAIFAVTARHLLGDAGGVEPEVLIGQLDKNLIEWQMSPRIVTDAARETVKLNAKNLDFANSTKDLVLLKVASETFDLAVLKPNFNLPTINETLYLIGCPYSERQCKQNSYKVNFVAYDYKESQLIGTIDHDVDLSGFSGAPLVNGGGEAIGVLVGGGESGGKKLVTATHIKEIQNVKF